MQRSNFNNVYFTAPLLGIFIIGSLAFSSISSAADETENAEPSAADGEQPSLGGETPCSAKPHETNDDDVERRGAGQASDAAVTKSPQIERPLIHGVFRFTSYPVAWTAAQKSNRPILVYVTSCSCPHCVRMIEQTYKHPAVANLVSGSFETIYVDRHQQPRLIEKLKIRWYPTTIVVAPNNKVIDRIEGYVDSLAFTQRVKTQLATHDAVVKNAQQTLVQK